MVHHDATPEGILISHCERPSELMDRGWPFPWRAMADGIVGYGLSRDLALIRWQRAMLAACEQSSTRGPPL